MKDFKVIGIDPAPSKNSTIYDGEKFMQKDYVGLKDYIDKLNEKALICWDAPLTFPSIPKSKPKEYSPLYMRPIEYFFNYMEDITPPKGISVLGYAGCSHWAISQYILGLPRLNNFSNSQSKYTLIADDSQKVTKKSENGIYITEVHPALAMWMIIKKSKPTEDIINWKYKKSASARKEIIKSLKAIKCFEEMPSIKNDDELDAYIAWKLGSDWNENKGVSILGNNETGSFLLPYNDVIFKAFKDFVK
ncbi:MAG TPA: hypothetical protein DG754_05105 [Bacteroidales bacterium]|jgi:predicted RNase H-like nuclease|nr:hypothetical protein [Bacteroidales bacterium]